jgi:hypothetical protein
MVKELSLRLLLLYDTSETLTVLVFFCRKGLNIFYVVIASKLRASFYKRRSSERFNRDIIINLKVRNITH